MHEQKQSIDQKGAKINRISLQKSIKIFEQILSGFALIIGNKSCIICVVSFFAELKTQFKVSYCSIDIYLVIHTLFLVIIFFLLYLYLILFLVNYDCIGVVLDCFLISS